LATWEEGNFELCDCISYPYITTRFNHKIKENRTMQIKPALHKAIELGIGITAITTLILAGCGGGGSSGSNTTPTAAVKIVSYQGPFSSGTVVIKDANGSSVALASGGTINASGVANVTFSNTVAYPLSVEVAGTYYNEITGEQETSAVPLRGLITSSAATDIPVTIVTETAVADLLNQAGGSSFSAAHPLQAATVVAALSDAGAMFGIPASAVPSFDSATHKSSDSNTIRLSALAVVANNQAGADLADRVKTLAHTMATLNAASAPSNVISQTALDAAMTAETSGSASSVAAADVTTQLAAPIISTAIKNPWIGTWVGPVTSTCGYFSGSLTTTITSTGSNGLHFSYAGTNISGAYNGTYSYSGNSATSSGGNVVFTLSADKNTMYAVEADSCQQGSSKRQ
jgi:hypothetical protein